MLLIYLGRATWKKSRILKVFDSILGQTNLEPPPLFPRVSPPRYYQISEDMQRAASEVVSEL